MIHETVIPVEPLITTGGLIIIALIGLVGTLVTVQINRLKTQVTAVRAQTENSHTDAPTPNLRENIDENHEAVMSRLDNMSSVMTGMIDTQRRQGNKIDRLFSMSRTNSESIQELKERNYS